MGSAACAARFPDSEFNNNLRNSYNRLIDEFYDAVIDFITLHYHLNNRTDTDYWRFAREEAPVPDSLKQKLELWRHKMPGPIDLSTEHLFNANNYLTALMGKGFYDQAPPQFHGVVETDLRQYLVARREQTEKLLSDLPGDVALLRAIRGASTGAPSTPTPVKFNLKLDN